LKFEIQFHKGAVFLIQLLRPDTSLLFFLGIDSDSGLVGFKLFLLQNDFWHRHRVVFSAKTPTHKGPEACQDRMDRGMMSGE
jgi:hypothetical protein